jgi:peptide/nickel transport system permease protein
MKSSAIRPIALVLSRELIITILLLLGVSFVVFTILFASPGDPLSVLLEGQLSTAEVRAGVREAMGMPRSWTG